ncbi:lipase [Cellvibrio zantedeschiae]|uniref:Lipase n=1 Tax=Cellvibrio zantedeschiae TaxID=1237077 RepID=A0ABQ3ANG9_9GAMM|nr:alpha/beta hydrolase [Cellvibrio zantedeschiae]GGY61568.1 lipase [Cellvibrio zantedeschiae]
MKSIKVGVWVCLIVSFAQAAWAEDQTQWAPDKRDITYAGVEATDNPRKLDVYLPAKAKKPFPLLVWYHGGGLTSGTKNYVNDQRIASYWRSKGVAVVNVDYRLSPQVKFPAYIEDAAQATAWAFRNAAKLGADPKRIYVGGHSAGAYLATMQAMDERYLRAQGVELTSLAGFISLSGQMTTHFNVRKERGLSDLPLVVDDAAPSHYIRKNIPRLLLLIGDHDWPARLEENQLMYAQFVQLAKTDKASFKVIADRDHNAIYDRIPQPQDETYKVISEFIGVD